MLVHGIGPVPSLLSLPFAPFGFEATYNGAVLTGFFLTGYCTWLLARALGLGYLVALFAGTMVISAEMHLAGLLGHVEKIFFALLPLVLLACVHALDLKRPRWWALVVALLLFLTLLTSGWQFLSAAIGIALFICTRFLVASKNDWPTLLKRVGLFLVAAGILVLPLLAAILLAARNPALNIEYANQSANYSPDLVEFVLPSHFSMFGAGVSRSFLNVHKIHWSVESAVSLSFIGIVLVLLGLATRRKMVGPWFLIFVVSVVLSFGPTLKVLGHQVLPLQNLPVTLPYEWISSIPGLGFMRTPGRFMLLGYTAFGIGAAIGLGWLTTRVPKFRYVIPIVAIVLVLVEAWPKPWPVEKLLPVPDFYKQIRADTDVYGVFDLPLAAAPSRGFIDHSSFYQIYQMTHQKGIASGYLSRTYTAHPVFPCWIPAGESKQVDVLLNNSATDCFDAAEYDLARAGYRYVVLHKRFGGRQSAKKAHKQANNIIEYAYAKEFISRVFGERAPIVNDALTEVYAIKPIANYSELPLSLQLGENWYGRENGFRWAHSTATLRITSPLNQSAVLEIRPYLMHDPKSENGIGERGNLIVETGAESLVIPLRSRELVAIPLKLRAGFQEVKLTLQAGNFRPKDYGASDSRVLSFSIRSVHLKTVK